MPGPPGASCFGVSICRGTLGFGEAVSPSASEPSWRKFFREPKRGTARFCSVREHPLSPAPEKWPSPRVFLPGVPGVGSACGVSAPAAPAEACLDGVCHPGPVFCILASGCFITQRARHCPVPTLVVGGP